MKAPLATAAFLLALAPGVAGAQECDLEPVADFCDALDGRGEDRATDCWIAAIEAGWTRLSMLDIGRFTDYVASFDGFDLDGASFGGARFTGTSFVRANMSGADLSGADLSDADLSGADLTGADLTGADLSGAVASLWTKGIDRTDWVARGGTLTLPDQLRSLDLSIVDLSYVDLSGKDLSGHDLLGTNLRGANLSGANLSGAILMDADLTGADLTGADLSGAQLYRARVSRRTTVGVDFGTWPGIVED